MIPSISPWRGSQRFFGVVVVAFAALGLALPSAGAQQAGDAVASRINRLEQQFQDLQVSVGTLESFLRPKPGSVLPQEAPQAAPDALASTTAMGDLDARVGALETQIGALTNQLEQISRQMAALEAKLAATPSPPPSQALAPQPTPRQPDAPQAAQQTAAPQELPSQALASTEDDPAKPRWYGSPTDATDNKPQSVLPPASSGGASSDQITAALPSGDAQALYEQGYGSMLQHDYGAAEAAFRQLVAAHPNDPLAGSAQYWIGESYYVRGQYKSAADAFLMGYKKYKASDKAPDTLLKLGMSLAELGQKDAACSTFNELAKKYPNAPEHVIDQAQGERKKAGC
ncbi:MAG: tol-pal system protein YbgF [Actinomycetota bacterium]